MPRLAATLAAPEGEPAPSRGSRLGDARWLVVIFVVAVAAVRLPSFAHQLYDPDEAAIAVQGIGLERGGVLYADVIDRKPPLAPTLYATVFRITGTHDLRPLHVLAAIELVGAALLIAWELRERAGPEAGLWGGLLLIGGALALVPQDAQAANFSQLALLPGVAAIVLARRDSARAVVGAGLCVAIATLTRQTWAIGVIPAAFAAWWHGGRRWTRPAILVGATLAGVASVGLMVPFGAFLHWTFTGNGSLLFDISRFGHVFAAAWASIGLFVAGHVVALALVGLHRWHREEADLWLWALCGLLSVMAGARFFGHYWLQFLPALVLLAAPAVPALARRWKAAAGGLLAATAVVYFVLACVPDQIHRLPNASRLAAVVRAHSTSHDRVGVWGSYPEVYWLADRLPAAGLIHTDFVVGKSAGRLESPATLRDATPGAIDSYLDVMTHEPPKLFVDTSTADLRGYGHYPITVLPGLARLIRTEYHRIAVVDRVTVYERNAPAPRRDPDDSPYTVDTGSP